MFSPLLVCRCSPYSTDSDLSNILFCQLCNDDRSSLWDKQTRVCSHFYVTLKSGLKHRSYSSHRHSMVRDPLCKVDEKHKNAVNMMNCHWILYQKQERKMQKFYTMKINDLLFLSRLITSNCSKSIYSIFNYWLRIYLYKKRRSITGRVYFREAKLLLSAEIWLVRKGTISIFINCLLIDWHDTAVVSVARVEILFRRNLVSITEPHVNANPIISQSLQSLHAHCITLIVV